MEKKQIKITVNEKTARYLYNSLLGTSRCVEALVEEALENRSKGVDRKTKKELTNTTKLLDTAIQKVKLRHPEADTTELRGVYDRYAYVIELLWEK